jgi:hypothetical protein
MGWQVDARKDKLPSNFAADRRLRRRERRKYGPRSAAQRTERCGARLSGPHRSDRHRRHRRNRGWDHRWEFSGDAFFGWTLSGRRLRRGTRERRPMRERESEPAGESRRAASETGRAERSSAHPFGVARQARAARGDLLEPDQRRKHSVTASARSSTGQSIRLRI